MTYVPAGDRYERLEYRHTGRSGLKLPPVSFGLWHNYGHNALPERARKMLHTAFDLGITHFDLANNYGPPPGSAEEYFGGEARVTPIRLPFRVTETEGRYAASGLVAGGGVSGQAGAIRHGIARALLAGHPDFRSSLREAGLLTRDPRAKERKKYGLKRARKAPQYTKR